MSNIKEKFKNFILRFDANPDLTTDEEGYYEDLGTQRTWIGYEAGYTAAQGELSASLVDIEYPRDAFATLIDKNSPYAFYLFGWVPYQENQRLRLKMRHDVKTCDGREALGIWPNGNSCGPFKDEEVEFIRISREQFGDPWEQPAADTKELPSEVEEILTRLRGQLQNCVNHLDRVKKRGGRQDEEIIRECVESANKCLYETLHTNIRLNDGSPLPKYIDPEDVPAMYADDIDFAECYADGFNACLSSVIESRQQGGDQ